MEAKQIGETLTRKGRNGWESRTEFEFDAAKDQRLTVSTRKDGRGGISAFASVSVHKDGFMTHAVFRDYSKTMLRAPGRCTDKSIERLHAEALTLIGNFMADARTHYTMLEHRQRS